MNLKAFKNIKNINIKYLIKEAVATTFNRGLVKYLILKVYI